jgi:hypothetical protein
MSLKVKSKFDISKDIKVKLPLTIENLGYKIPETPISDEDIYYFIGKKALQGIEAIPGSHTSKIKIEAKNYSKEQIIEYAKTKMMPLVPDDKEFIPRKYWCDFKELLGSNLNNESHPLWSLSHQIIKDNYIKHSDTMLLQACGNYKPYIDNQVYQGTLKLYREGYFDLFISSWELTPIDFSPFFPWRYYDWSHSKETPFMTRVCIDHEFRNVYDFVEYFKYKRIIIFAPGGDDYFYNELFRRLKNNYNNSPVTVEMIWDKDTINKFISDGYHAKGILKARYYILPQGTNKLKKLINYNPKHLTDPNDWNYGIEDKELIKYLRRNKDLNWINKYRKLSKLKINIKGII